MTDVVEPTFTVEVLSFPGAADPEALAESVSAFFGIAVEQARQMVEKTPIRVKRGAPAAAAQTLVGQLHELGADVCVRNEQTGEERTYKLGSQSAPPRSDPRAEPKSDPKATRRSDPRNESRISVPTSLSSSQAGVVVATGADALQAAMAARRPRKGVTTNPGLPAPAPRTTPSDPAPVSAGAPAAASPAASVPAPAPSAPEAATPAAQRTSCAACSRPVDKGEVCAWCGWDSEEKKRVCRECKGELELTSTPRSKRLPVAAAIVVALGAGAGLFLLFGALGPIAPVALCCAGIFAADAATTRYRCPACKLDLGADRLQIKERGPINAVKGRAFALAAVFLGAALVTPVFFDWAVPELRLGALGSGSVWKLPRTYEPARRQETIDLTVAGEKKTLHLLRAEPGYLSGPTYVLMALPVTPVWTVANLDQPKLEAAAKDAAAAALEGGTVADIKPGAFSGARLGLSMTVSGTWKGAKVSGPMRALLYEHDVFFVALVSAGEVADADRILDAVEITH